MGAKLSERRIPGSDALGHQMVIDNGEGPRTPPHTCPEGTWCAPYTQHTVDSIRDTCLLCGRRGPWQVVSYLRKENESEEDPCTDGPADR